MKSDESCLLAQAESILDQLLKFTTQLAEVENDPQVNAKAISDACMMRLNELKQLLSPQNTAKESFPQFKSGILDKMRNLYGRTQICLEILERKNKRVVAEIQNLTRTRQAISAYRKRN